MIEPFLGPHIIKLSGEYEVHVATAFGNKLPSNDCLPYIAHDIPIKREISLAQDFRALYVLMKLCRRERIDILLSVTPKAALLTALAGFLCCVRYRIHFFTGQVWTNMTGAKKKLLMMFDKMVVLLDTGILADGHSQKDYLIDTKIVAPSKITVLGSGSVSGVNTERFMPNEKGKKGVRDELNIKEEELVFIFVGRITKDKGIDELLEAFKRLNAKKHNSKLLLVGYDEGEYIKKVSSLPNKNIIFVPPTPTPERYLQAADVFCCPSYREGFGLSVIEASSTELPVICSDAYGIMDAMVENVTGLRCRVKDVDSLYNCMLTLSENCQLRLGLGKNGRKRVLEEFTSERVSSCMKDYLTALIDHDTK